MLNIKNISYSYKSPTGISAALNNINAEISPGITAIAGRTGSGKTTLAEIISGITKSDKGEVSLNGKPISSQCGAAGIVFQYAEHQLFAETVYEDIAFGPKNLGLSGDKLDKCIREAAQLTGITDKQLSMSPHELSGGQKRLAALAGVLAMKPRLLVLDEPAAGLDPSGRARIFSILRSLCDSDREMIIIFVTHSMEAAAEYADSIIVLKDGSIAAQGSPYEIFSDTALINECGLDLPETAQLAAELSVRGINIGNVLTVNEAYSGIMEYLKGGGSDAS